MNEVFVVRHVPREGLGFLEQIFADEKIPYRYLDAYREPFPAVDLSKISALVVLGGPMGVYEADRYPFLASEIQLLKKAIHKEIPTLGICLGSQLLASAAGARVYRGPYKEIGWFPVEMRPEARRDPLLRHCPPETWVFHWHGDTFDLPKGALHLASSKQYAHQAFRIGTAWGLQFHMEVTESMIREWVEVDEKEREQVASKPSSLAQPDYDTCGILTQIPRFLPDMKVLATKVFGEFASLVKSFATR